MSMLDHHFTNHLHVFFSGTDMPGGEEHPSVSAKKVALRDLPSETNNFASDPIEYSPFKDKGSHPDSVKLSGTKRQQSSSPSTPSHTHQHSISSRNLVYVRRKLETEPNKVCVENEECADPPCFSTCQNDQSSETKLAEEQETKLSGVSALSPSSLNTSLLGSKPISFMMKPGILMVTPLENQSSPFSEIRGQGEEYWKERFIQLQMFLKNCDHSNQEKYVQRLRSLSAAGRSRHAIELEKRAIQLLLDEGRELHKMKVLNVLGKPTPDSQSTL